MITWLRFLGVVLCLSFFSVGFIPANVSKDEVKLEFVEKKRKKGVIEGDSVRIGPYVYKKAPAPEEYKEKKDIVSKKKMRIQDSGSNELRWRWWYGLIVIIGLFLLGQYWIQKWGSAGFSLVELMCSASLFLIVVAAMMNLFSVVNPYFKAAEGKIERTIKAKNMAFFFSKVLGGLCSDTDHSIELIEGGKGLRFYTCSLDSDGETQFIGPLEIKYDSDKKQVLFNNQVREVVVGYNISLLQFSLDNDRIQVEYKVSDTLYEYQVARRLA